MTNISKIDNKISELKTLEDQISKLTELREATRAELFQVIEKESLETYKNDNATVSYVVRKSVKIKDPEKLLADLQSQKLTKFYEVVPEEVIPEHLTLKPEFDKEIKEGKFNHPEVEVTESKNLSIRFNKETK
jgi:hypothetical protein